MKVVQEDNKWTGTSVVQTGHGDQKDVMEHREMLWLATRRS
jgi:hypothetical protein